MAVFSQLLLAAGLPGAHLSDFGLVVVHQPNWWVLVVKEGGYLVVQLLNGSFNLVRSQRLRILPTAARSERQQCQRVRDVRQLADRRSHSIGSGAHTTGDTTGEHTGDTTGEHTGSIDHTTGNTADRA